MSALAFLNLVLSVFFFKIILIDRTSDLKGLKKKMLLAHNFHVIVIGYYLT